MRFRPIDLLLAGLTLSLLGIATASLDWRMHHDAPLLLYFGWLIDTLGRVPYRDVFEFNLPGSYLLNIGIGRVFGYEDFGFRCADLSALALLLGLTWGWMRSWGARVAACGALLFGLCYLELGSGISLQREFLLLLPLAAALLLQPRTQGKPLRWLGFGLMFGLILTIKPHAAVPGLALLGIEVWKRRARSREGLACLAGMSLIPGLILIWLAQADALGDFLEIARNYWPLYTQINGEHYVLTGPIRWLYLAWNYRVFGGHGLWLVPAALGMYLALSRTAKTADPRPAGNDRAVVPDTAGTDRSVASGLTSDAGRLLGLVVYFSLYPLVAGQFWDYHWLPFLYFAVQAAALCLLPALETDRTGSRLFPVTVLLFAVALNVQPPREILDRLMGQPALLPKSGRPDAMAAYLKQHLRPGDSVQPLDWSGGAIHAMLMAKAQPATPFLYDFTFYHHVDQPYIQVLRHRFLAELDSAQPRFILQVYKEKPFVSGPGTTRSFPELEQRLSTEYTIVLAGDGFNIHERIRR